MSLLTVVTVLRRRIVPVRGGHFDFRRHLRPFCDGRRSEATGKDDACGAPQNRYDAASKLMAEKAVNERINAAVRRAHPLENGHQVVE